MPRFYVEKFLSHSAEKFRRRTFYCSTNFGYPKSLDRRRRGEYQDFPSKFFCLTVPKNFAFQSFTVAIISGIEKVWIRRGASRFSVEIFLSHSAEKFRGAIFHCCNNFGYRKNLDKRVGIKIFRRKFFVSQC